MRTLNRTGAPAWSIIGTWAAALALGWIGGSASAQPVNDHCDQALAIGEGVHPFDTRSADTDGVVFACVGEDFTSNDVWFLYTPSQSRRAIFDTCLSDFDTIITILDMCGGLELACSNDQCGQQSRVGYDVVAGTPYLVRVAGYFSASGTGALRIALQSGPQNDLCANATPVGEGTFAFSTEGASTDGDGGCGGGSNDVWFRYSPAATGVATFQTCGSSFDTILSVRSTCGGAELACNDDACATGSRLSLGVQGGASYLIRIAGFDGSVGAGDLRITRAAPPTSCIGRPPGSILEDEACGGASNNGCAGPGQGFTPLTCGNSTTFGTAFTTSAAQDSDWYRITLPGAATVTLTLQADFAASLTLTTGACPGNVLATSNAPVRCADTATIVAALAPGTYSIGVEMIPPVAAPCGTANNYILSVATSTCEAQGACCTASGCSLMSAASCVSAGGTYLGDQTTCTSTVLDPVFAASDLPAPIQDVDSDLGTPGQTSVVLNIEGSGVLIPPTGIAVSVGLTHSAAGDLRLNLSNLFNSIIFVDQVGFDGAGGREESDFAGVYRFYDGAPGDLWGAAAIAGPQQAIPPGDYEARGPNGSHESLGAAFQGTNLDGSWILAISDHALRGTGTIDSFAIALTTSVNNCTRCPAEFNGDGQLNADDLGDYITCYFDTPPCPRAEFNHDGSLNADDLGDYITAYFNGCP